MTMRPRANAAAVSSAPSGSVTLRVSLKMMHVDLVRHAGSHGLWQHGSCVGSVMGVVPVVGSRGGLLSAMSRLLARTLMTAPVFARAPAQRIPIHLFKLGRV